MRLAEIGPKGQLKLKSSSVLLIGLGGLGSPAAMYLAAAGVGRIGIVEFDNVDASNLHRQVLYGIDQVGRPKLASGANRLRALNPHVVIEEHPFRFAADNARKLVRGYDIVVDGADNFSTRYMVNDACVLEGRPLVSASILGFEGQLSVFNLRSHATGELGPCYRCLYPDPPEAGTVPSCAEAGVLGSTAGTMACLQAGEALKVLLGIGEPASGRLIHFDALSLSFNDLKIHRSPDCPLCGDRPSIKEVAEHAALCAPVALASISPVELKQRLEKDAGSYLLIDVRETDERATCAILPSAHHPLAEFLQTAPSLPADKTVVFYCKGGGRSLKAAQHAAKSGHGNVLNLSGGILAWIEQIDPKLQKY